MAYRRRRPQPPGISYIPCVFLLLAALSVLPQDLTVTTFNVRYGTADDGENRWERRRDLVFDVLRAQEADVVGLQEVLRFQLDEILAALPEYGAIGAGREDGRAAGEYAAILFRLDRFDVDTGGTFWLSPTPEVPGSTGWGNQIARICTWVSLVDRAAGGAVHVFNAHLDHESQRSRALAAELIVRRIAERYSDDPVILLGDFNAGEENPVRRFLTGAIPRAAPGDAEDPPPQIVLHDAFRALHSGASEVGTYHAFAGATDGDMIDAILVSPVFDVAAARIDRTARGGRYPSDHFPVTARLRRR